MQVRSPAVDDALHIIGLHHLGVVRKRLAGAFAHDLGDYFAAVASEELASVPRVVSWSRIPVPVLTAAATNATGMYSYGLLVSQATSCRNTVLLMRMHSQSASKQKLLPVLWCIAGTFSTT